MTRLSRFVKTIIILFLTPIFSGCPPLNFKIFIRNTTEYPAQLILFYHKDFVRDTILLKSTGTLLKINNKTLTQLHQKLVAISDAEKTMLTLPPKHTVFLNDLIEYSDNLKNKTLIIHSNNKKDTLALHYPYRNIKTIKRVSDRTYNYLYKTIIYYDIK